MELLAMNSLNEEKQKDLKKYEIYLQYSKIFSN